MAASSTTLFPPTFSFTTIKQHHYAFSPSSLSFNGLKPINTKTISTKDAMSTTRPRSSVVVKAELSPQLVISLSTGLSLFLGRFVFFNFQRENVAKQGLPEQNGMSHFEAGDSRAKEMSRQSHLLASNAKSEGKQKMIQRALIPPLSSLGPGLQRGQGSGTPLLPALHDNNNDMKPYPLPIASYQHVVQDVAKFKESHDHFFKMLGKHVEVPKIGEVDLDLHRLFIEVTSRGGFEKINMDHKWEEVVNAYIFPPTPTISNPSLFLCNSYMSLLYHYEQVYYFRMRNFGAAVPEITSTCNENNESTQGVAPSANPSLEGIIGSTLSGTIEGECDDGYFVTVDLGCDRLKGILYPVSEEMVDPQIVESTVVSPHQNPERSQSDSGRPKP